MARLSEILQMTERKLNYCYDIVSRFAAKHQWLTFATIETPDQSAHNTVSKCYWSALKHYQCDVENDQSVLVQDYDIFFL